MIDLEKIKRSVGIIGESVEMTEMLTLISQISNTDISVLITGESGSGKEMVAKAIHKNSKRKLPYGSWGPGSMCKILLWGVRVFLAIGKSLNSTFIYLFYIFSKK